MNLLHAVNLPQARSYVAAHRAILVAVATDVIEELEPPRDQPLNAGRILAMLDDAYALDGS